MKGRLEAIDVSGSRGRQVARLDNPHRQHFLVVVIDEREVDLAERRRLDGPVEIDFAEAPGLDRRNLRRFDRRLGVQFRLQALDRHLGSQAGSISNYHYHVWRYQSRINLFLRSA